MHREVFKREILVFADTLGDIVGKRAEKAMMASGKMAFLEIARRLPASFDDMAENDAIEMFRKASLFLGLKSGFERTKREFYLSAKTREELEKIKREHDIKILLELCPDFPTEHFDEFCRLYSEYCAKIRRRRRPLRDYFELSPETSEEKAEREAEHKKQEEELKKYKEKRAEKIREKTRETPDGLSILAFFCQDENIRSVLAHFPIQLDNSELSRSDYEKASENAGVSGEEALFCFRRFDTFRSEFRDFTTSENGKPCGRIVYLRAEKDEGAANDLLQGGRSVFLFHEQKKDENISEADEESIFRASIEKAFSKGYSLAHCYIITEPMSSLPITISGEL